MGRILSIDYGRKRVGIAVTDPLQMIATGLTTVPAHNVIDFLTEYVQKEQVDLFVIGEPKTVRNEASESQRYLIPFLNRLKKVFPHMQIVMIDERFTSKMAFQSMIDSGLKKSDRRKKEIIDTVSATIILQSYLEQKTNLLL